MSTDAQPRQTNGRRTRARATLIGSGTPAAAIAQLLAEHGLKAARFARVEDVPDEDDRPAVVVLWAHDPSSSPALARATAAAAQRFEGTPIVVVCERIERWGIRAALASGAAGVVLYGELHSTFGPCLQAVLAGQACVPQAHSRQIEPPPLSTREKQILGLVVMGYMNSQIAERLYLAESTVKSHLSSAFGKLGVRSRNEAVKLIVSPDSGLGLGILGLGVEPVATAGAAGR